MSVKLLRWSALLAAGIVALAVLPAPAADTPQEDEETPDQVVEDIMTAYRTADFGRDHQAPEALVAAASMLRALSAAKMGQITEEPVIAGEGKAEVVADKGLKEEAEDLFDEASALGLKLKQPGIDALIKSAHERSYRAVIGGPKKVHRKISNGQSHTFTFKFEAYKPVAVAFTSSVAMDVTIICVEDNHVLHRGMTKHHCHHGMVAHKGQPAVKGKPAGKGKPGGKAKPSGTGEQITIMVIIRHAGKEAGDYQLMAN